MTLIKNKKIAIIGGGPGGLTLARLLQMNGAEVTVYERDLNRNVRVQGATLNINEESGLKAIQKAELMTEFRTYYRPGAEKMIFLDRNGNTVIDDVGGDLKETRPEIDRGPLRELLLNSLQENTVVWDSQFSSLTEINDGIKLEFKNGTAAVADIVVGADGSRSKIRPYITNVKPLYSGVTVVEAAIGNAESVIPRIHKLLDGGKIFALGDEKCLFAMVKGDGSVVFYSSHKTGEFWFRDGGVDFLNKDQVIGWFKDEFKGWSELWSELYENADPVFIPRPQYFVPFDQNWEPLKNLTMLGDAAHVMPPFAGDGVNMAMLDALELAECLLSKNFIDAKSAIAAYEKEMCERSSVSVQKTVEFTNIFHSSDAIPFFRKFFSHIGKSDEVPDAGK